MLSLQFALAVVLLELTAGSFLSLALLDMRGDTSRGFVVFQGALYFVFALLTLGAINSFASPSLFHGLGFDERWLGALTPLVLALTVLMIPWNVLLWRDKPAEPAKKKGKVVRAPVTTLTRVRFALGIVVSLVGLAALFVEGMAYRTLAASRIDGALVVAAFLMGAIALGGVMTAMLLGHWYLNTPTASGKPLEFATTLMLGALVLELIFTLFIGPTTAHPTIALTHVSPGTTIVADGSHVTVSTPTTAPATSKTPGKNETAAAVVAKQAPLTTGAMGWLEILLGFVSPIILGAVALYLTRGRSFQSATGMLYLCVSFIFIGEILGRGLLVAPIFS